MTHKKLICNLLLHFELPKFESEENLNNFSGNPL